MLGKKLAIFLPTQYIPRGMYCFNTPERGVLEGGCIRGGLYLCYLPGGPKCSKNQSKSMSKVPISSHKHAYFALLSQNIAPGSSKTRIWYLFLHKKVIQGYIVGILFQKLFWGDVLLHHPPERGVY